MNNLIKDTIGKIKKEHIKPTQKWKFLVKKYSTWLLFGLIVFFGGISFSVAFYLMSSLDWDLYRFVHQNIFSYSLSIFPYFWAFILAVIAFAAFFDLRKTQMGYRFSFAKILVSTFGAIVVLGALLSYLNLGRNFNNMMTNGVPFYGQHMMVTKESQWTNPAGGFLSGTISSYSADNIELIDFSGKKWEIKIDEKTLIRTRAEISNGQMIKIIGTKIDEHVFQAIEIRPWNGMGQGMMGGGRGQMGR
ncbi:MAG: hypothetical protein WCI36_01255 [bacterium]